MCANKPLKVEVIVRTCESVPSEWVGFTTDMKIVYARYRGGLLTVQVGATFDVMTMPTFYSAFRGDSLDGVLAYDELKNATRGYIEWPLKQLIHR